jgi:putative ABC transport system permease protein
MIEILRNMRRHKMRTGLTVFGIVIGIFALTVMGSMSEYFNNLLEGAMKYAGHSITVQADTRGGASPLTVNSVRRLRRLPGVEEAIPTVMDTLEEMSGGVQVGMPELVYGAPPEQVEAGMGGVKLLAGRWLQRGDTYHAVVGADVARKRDLRLGDAITWREKELAVVGIMQSTETTPDQMVIVPIETVWRVIERPNLIMSISVIPANPSQADALAKLIAERIPGVEAQTPQEAIDEVRQGLIVFNVIMLSGALLAVIVGGLAVINTMIMSVTERTREIGIKKAVGADDLDIVMEYVTEAGIIGLLGGVTGLVLGTGMANLLNATAAQQLGGTEVFTVTPRLIVVALIFATGLGGVGGLYPAWRAARLDPVKALRRE